MRKLLIGVSACLIASVLSGGTGAGEVESEPTDVAAAYFAAIQASDLDSAERLFARESSIYETGGIEGSWKHYREHHLGPEIDEISSFTINRKNPEVATSEDETLAIVAWPIDYTIALKDNRTNWSRGTVTFVLIREADVYKIRHLHWSSRRMDSKP